MAMDYIHHVNNIWRFPGVKLPDISVSLSSLGWLLDTYLGHWAVSGSPSEKTKLLTEI